MKYQVMKWNKMLGLLAVLVLSIQSCVPTAKLEEQKSLVARYQTESELCQTELEQTKAELAQSSEALANCEQSKKALEADTTRAGIRQQQLAQRNAELDEMNSNLRSRNDALANRASAAQESLNNKLADKERELLDKERKLNQMQADITKGQADNQSLQAALGAREARVKELESLIARKDSASELLRSKIARALNKFNASELSVEMRNGKVYVSLSNKLLFKSGSAQVDPKGVEALGSLAEVLKSESDLNILVEGHTDNDAFNGSGEIKDNWDLSVIRATNVVKILTKRNGVAPERVTAAGRGEFMPIASNDSPEGKATNRRTDIVISPDLDEIMKLLDQ